MNSFDAVLEQYKKNSQSGNKNNQKVSQDERLKKYFTLLLPKGSKSGEKRIRILPTKDGSSPFVEVNFHEIEVDGKKLKIYDPAQEGKRSPLNEVRDGLLLQGDEQAKELAKQYRSKKFYIVKVIDRDNEQEGVKFWRFKHSLKQDGILDKIIPLFQKKGDITDSQNGRDLTLFLTVAKTNMGGEYTTVSTIMPEDVSSLHDDAEIAKKWLNDELTWSDVYSKKSEDYLEMVAKGETPRWDSVTNKWVSNSYSEETIVATPEVKDYQDSQEPDDDIPF